MRVALIKKQLPASLIYQFFNVLNVAQGAISHHMSLQRHATRPSLTKLGDGKAAVVEQRATCAETLLGELLRGHQAEGKPAVHYLVWEAVSSGYPSGSKRSKAKRFGVLYPGFDGREGATLVEVGYGHVVARRAQLVGKCGNALGQTLGMVKEQDVSHFDLFS